jgi:hypothetical protein
VMEFMVAWQWVTVVVTYGPQCWFGNGRLAPYVLSLLCVSLVRIALTFHLTNTLARCLWVWTPRTATCPSVFTFLASTGVNTTSCDSRERLNSQYRTLCHILQTMSTCLRLHDVPQRLATQPHSCNIVRCDRRRAKAQGRGSLLDVSTKRSFSVRWVHFNT